jgi:lauroyl/myristoyl acyltransferase
MARWPTLADAGTVAKLVLALPFACLVPFQCWRPLCRAIANASTRLRPGGSVREARRIEAIAGNRLTQSSALAARRNFSALNHEKLLIVLQQHCPWARAPKVRLTGADHIAEALHQGHGVILWLGNFVFSTAFEPFALSRAGIPMHHLARPEHGFSESPFAQRYINPIMTAVEDRYLAERILLHKDASSALLTMRRHLRDNKVVSLRAHRYARSALEVPFLNGWLRLASGPVELAQLAGAPLLPTFTLRTADGGYEVRVGGPIPLCMGSDREKTCQAAIEYYAKQLEPIVLSHPDQWISWYSQARPREPGEPHETHRVSLQPG